MDPVYVFGHSEREQQRLMAQEGFLGAFTEQLLCDAGIGPGMRVLDVGCGVGDVSFLAARLVGSEGKVVGVDRSAETLATARARARERTLPQVSFVEGDLRELVFDRLFDAAIGRFVLMYQPEPAAFVRVAASNVRPGGVVAFQEIDAGCPPLSLIQAKLGEQCVAWINRTYTAAGIHLRMGAKLFGAFIDAGLLPPTMRADVRIGGGPDYTGYWHYAELIRSLLPMMERFGIATAAEVDVDTLEERLRAEVMAGGGAMVSPPLVGAFSQRPA